LWYPAHSAKDAEWMGHPAFVEFAPGHLGAYFAFASEGAPDRRDGWGLWYPTHSAKDAEWMGHPAFVELAPGHLGAYFAFASEGAPDRRDGWGLWYPTHSAKDAEWMGHPAVPNTFAVEASLARGPGARSQEYLASRKR